MSQHDEELLNAIDKMINERTFSLEAVEAVKNMRTTLGETKSNLDLAAKRVISLEDQLKVSQEFGTLTDQKLRDYEGREQGLVMRENKMTKLECDADKESAVAEAYKHSLETIFKPRAMREETYKNHQDNYLPAGGSEKIETGSTKTSSEE